MKSYTDIEQSKKLAEILPLESADMHYKVNRHNNESKIFMIPYSELGYYKDNDYQYTVCAWSLAALLVILAKIASKIDDDGSADLSSFMGQWSVNMLDCPVQATDNYDSAVDACVEMIIKLNELNLL